MLAMMKARLTGAVKGHALLKKKADALTLRRACVHSCCRSLRAHRVLLPTVAALSPALCPTRTRCCLTIQSVDSTLLLDCNKLFYGPVADRALLVARAGSARS